MAIEVFNRHEKKYQLDYDKFYKLKNDISDYMELDKNNKRGKSYVIANLYYDTEDSYLIRHSLQKPTYKEKLRLRTYGVPDENKKVFLEIKKKVNGTVNKRRSSIVLNDAYAFLETGDMPELAPYMNGQVLKEVDYILEKKILKPKVYLAYDRTAYFSIEDQDLRISFDSDIRYRENHLRLEEGDFGKLILPKESYLMEIKTSKAMPTWICNLLSKHKIYSSSFSKYGYVYQNCINQINEPRKTFYFPTSPVYKEVRTVAANFQALS